MKTQVTMQYTQVCIIASLLARLIASQQTPVELNWASETYGPDGPWNALNISIGNPQQYMALYPGALRNFQVLSSKMCSPTTGQTCYPAEAGTFNEGISQTQQVKPEHLIQSGLSWCQPLISHQNMSNYTDQVRLGNVNETPLTNMTIWALDDADIILPNGTRYPPTVGLAALGAPPYDDQGKIIDTPVNATPPSQLYQLGKIPSASFGLHIGSANPPIPGSMFYGGYDKSRVLGQVSSQQYLLFGQGTKGSGVVKLQMDLQDIGLGVAYGGSPFSQETVSGLLAAGNSSITDAVLARIGANAPYLHLPRSTCDAIAAELPVTFNADFGLYLWNVDDPRYQQIVNSPSFLSFNFRTTQGSDDLTIKVPFMLLNLNLTPPLMPEPTPYFPCSPLDYSVYTLGRAFLQAAFWGANWSPADAEAAGGAGYWWLAQAPGPNTSLNPIITSINPADTELEADGTNWADTWSGYWTPLPMPDPGLSTGAKAGIGVGASVGALLIVILITYLCMRKRRKQKQEQTSRRGTEASSDPSETNLKKEDTTMSPLEGEEEDVTPSTVDRQDSRDQWIHEMEETSRPRVELIGLSAKHEMDPGMDGRGPEAGNRLNPAEVGANEEVFGRHEMPTSAQRTPEPPGTPGELEGEEPRTLTSKEIEDALERQKEKQQSWPLPDEPFAHEIPDETSSEPSPPEPIDQEEKRRLWRTYNGAG